MSRSWACWWHPGHVEQLFTSRQEWMDLEVSIEVGSGE